MHEHTSQSCLIHQAWPRLEDFRSLISLSWPAVILFCTQDTNSFTQQVDNKVVLKVEMETLRLASKMDPLYEIPGSS